MSRHPIEPQTTPEIEAKKQKFTEQFKREPEKQATAWQVLGMVQDLADAGMTLSKAMVTVMTWLRQAQSP